MSKQGWARRLTCGAFALAALAVPATAQATTAAYSPDADARAFSNSAGGWSADTEFQNGLCVTQVTCPAIDGSYVATDGTRGAGDGFLQVSVQSLASAAPTRAH